MTTEPTPTRQKHPKSMVMHQGGGSNPVYGIGMIGAWIYYFLRAKREWVLQIPGLF